MNPPSNDQTNQIIKEALEFASRNFLLDTLFFVDSKKETELCTKISTLTEIEVIPQLFTILFCKKKQLAMHIAKTIEKILINASAEEFEMLDLHMRRIYYPQELFTLRTVSNVDTMILAEDSRNTIFALLSMHPSGYIRQQAMTKLSPLFPHITLPVLLIRANDWVKQIRNLASVKLRECLTTDDTKSFLPFLPLIIKLYDKQRHNHISLIEAIEQRLIQNNYQQLLDLILTANQPINRIAFRIAAKNETNISNLVQLAIKSRDIVIKLETISLIRDRLFGTSQWDALYHLLKDTSPIIRKQSLYALIKINPTKTNEILKNHLFDKSKPIRELARYYLKQNGYDIAHIYHEALNKKEVLPLAIIGLAEVGTQKDFNLIEAYLLNNCLHLKKAAIYALFKLKPENKQALLLNHTYYEHAILKTICNELLQDTTGFDLDEIEKKFCYYNDEYVRYLFSKIKILQFTDRWELIEYLVSQLLQEKSEKIRGFLRSSILRWIKKNSPYKVFVKPNEQAINNLLPKIDSLIAKNSDNQLFQNLKANVMHFK